MISTIKIESNFLEIILNFDTIFTVSCKYSFANIVFYVPVDIIIGKFIIQNIEFSEFVQSFLADHIIMYDGPISDKKESVLAPKSEAKVMKMKLNLDDTS